MSLRFLCAIACLALAPIGGWTQTYVVKGGVRLVEFSGAAAKDQSNIVVWLVPIGNARGDIEEVWKAKDAALPHPRLVQTGKHFEPHLLIVRVGTEVEFPNKDPFFHNAFSLFEGKRFDLGLYEAGSTRTVRFDKPGISYIFCNIHSEMSAVVIALETPYYAISNRKGEIAISNVPPGRYRMNVWAEGSSPEDLNMFSRELSIPEPDQYLGIIRLTKQRPLEIGHKNKYGKDYDDLTPGTPGYAR
jgi:plastocyanin